MAGRLYVVETDESVSVVRAVSPGKALNHVAQGQYKVRKATAEDIESYLKEGGEIEETEASEEVAEEEPSDD